MTSPDSAELLALRARVLFVHDESGDIVALNEAGNPAAPLVYLARAADATLLRFAPGASPALREVVSRFVAALPSWRRGEGGNAVARELAAIAGLAAAPWQGPAFRFPPPLFPPMGAMELYPAHARLLHPELALWGPDLTRSRPALAVLRAGQAVSICCSSRSIREAAEAGVETVAAFRGQGCAGLAVTAWADAVRASGRIPFYSTSWENGASLSVAAKLDLIEFGEDIHVG